MADQDYAKHHLWSVGTFIVAEVALAQVMAWLVARIVGGRDRSRIQQGDIWHKVFAVDVPRDREVQAMVLTKNAEYHGTVVGYTVNADISNRELELRHVTFGMRSDRKAQPQYLPAPFDRVVIASAGVEEIWLHYRNEIEPRPPWRERLKARWERRRLRARRKAVRRARRATRSMEPAEEPSSERSGDSLSDRFPAPQGGTRATAPSVPASDEITNDRRR